MEEDKIIKMMNDNSKLVYFCCNKFLQNERWKQYREELINEGVFGLWRGCLSYDEEKGTKISTYLVMCICNQIRMFLRKFRKQPQTISLESIIVQDDDNELNYNSIIAKNFDDIEQFELEEYTYLFFKYNKKYATKKSKQHIPVLIKMLSEGYRQVEIAKELQISQHTVGNYIAKLKEAIIKEREKDVKRSRVE